MNSTNRIVVLAVAMVSLAGTAFAQPASVPTSAPAGAYQIQETRLGPSDKDRLNPVFSRDGRHVAYVTTRGDKECVVLDGCPGVEFDGIADSPPVFSPNGKRLAYAARKGGKWSAVVDGQLGAEYDGIFDLIFSHDGKRVACIATKGEKKLVVVDGQPGAEYDSVFGLIFSPDGKRVAYGAWKGGNMVMVVDRQAGPEHDGILVATPLFSPDNNRVAYVAETGGAGPRRFAVVDGHVGAKYDYVWGLAFSPDGKSVVYGAGKDGKWWIVLDGHAGEEFDQICDGSPFFNPDGVLEYLAIRNNTLYRVKCVPVR